ncbi:hypothetical protein RHOFW104T7_03380 [Rhodanobacter thiooxydans]|uniref:Uncharacterized protein n=1 Tax=Rhodanobacter thiooxydans TaxID=416169 RepID=A0A154QCD8_9GAMM|nr:hypothetical protein [Rhodanobacter thiooxydans]EIL97674.1 hypothetical protein UUA_14174 [Rhodanobacter thiooxydans LCS2]KZC21898.1 hypothetical protein RHOFW104T7_03380 [Rhodanobacter thiooxydans]MCW0201641.1 hypothetical protein [Rhodanobacter thiooxydans]
MTKHTDDYIPAFDDPAREREWLAQESAMRRERLQLDPASDDARGQRYRLLARALREPLAEALPADFAQQLAARIAAAPVRRAANGGVESMLALALAITLVIAAAAVVAIHGSTWLPPFAALLPTPHAPATRWLLALGGCLGASWLLGQWQRHVRERTN